MANCDLTSAEYRSRDFGLGACYALKVVSSCDVDEVTSKVSLVLFVLRCRYSFSSNPPEMKNIFISVTTENNVTTENIPHTLFSTHPAASLEELPLTPSHSLSLAAPSDRTRFPVAEDAAHALSALLRRLRGRFRFSRSRWGVAEDLRGRACLSV